LTDFAAASATDLRAVETIGAALEGSASRSLVTPGTLLLAFTAPGRVGAEDQVADSALPRIGSENAAVALARRGVRSWVVRLSPAVLGERHGNHK
jgi:hypothetical protein